MAGVCYPTINFVIIKIWPRLIKLTEQIIYKSLGDGPFCFIARTISIPTSISFIGGVRYHKLLFTVLIREKKIKKFNYRIQQKI